MNRRIFPQLLALLIISICAPALASTWWDNHYTYRRPVDVTWDAPNAVGGELAQIQFYTAGHINPAGDDISVTTEDGTQVPSKVLMLGPGDLVRVAFGLTKGVTKYYVYFGNPKPTAPVKPPDELKIDRGLLLETKIFTGGASGNPEQLKAAWDRSQQKIGGLIISHPFYGVTPFGDQPQTISRYSGQLSVATDGDYTFAVSADSRGALFIDGQPIVYAPNSPGDVRYNKKINLKKGTHDFIIYQLHDGGEARLSVGWKRPDMNSIEVIERDAFGLLPNTVVGPLEGFQKKFTADIRIEYLGEYFMDGNYSHRYKLVAILPEDSKPNIDWDFGDDQTSTAAQSEHVYLTPGIYPIRITYKSGAFTDTQTFRLSVNRDFERLDRPQNDSALAQSKIVAGYDVKKIPPRWLPWAALLHLRDNRDDAMLDVSTQMADDKSHPDPARAFTTLQQVTEKCIAGPLSARALALWDRVPPDSDLQPRAARYQGQILVWWAADFDKAVKVIEPLAARDKNDNALQRMYAEALILDQKVEQGKRILLALPNQDDPRKQAALSGAFARSIEYFIDQGDWESGEDTWEKWESKYPSVFLEGYSVLLRIRLMEIKKAPQSAAKVAEAFATAIPNSSYSPTLLDRASKLIAKSDPQKSKDLREALKKRYPEDPLSQD